MRDNDAFQGLTGRRRYRDSAHGLILEVEFDFWNGSCWRCDWRDADVNDVMKVEVR